MHTCTSKCPEVCDTIIDIAYLPHNSRRPQHNLTSEGHTLSGKHQTDKDNVANKILPLFLEHITLIW